MENVDSKIFRPFEVGCDGVVLSEGLKEMVPILFFRLFDSKVIDHEYKGDVAGFVFEETGCVGALVVPVVNEVEDEFVLGDASSVGEAIHPF